MVGNLPVSVRWVYVRCKNVDANGVSGCVNHRSTTAASLYWPTSASAATSELSETNWEHARFSPLFLKHQYIIVWEYVCQWWEHWLGSGREGNCGGYVWRTMKRTFYVHRYHIFFFAISMPFFCIMHLAISELRLIAWKPGFPIIPRFKRSPNKMVYLVCINSRDFFPQKSPQFRRNLYCKRSPWAQH